MAGITDSDPDEVLSWLTKPDDFKPGSMGCHEALHVAGLIEALIDRELLDHPAIQMNETWLMHAEQAIHHIRELYREIGNEHLAA